MTARVTILCGPAGAGKTRRLVERYRAAAAGPFGSALWLGPSRRAIDAIRSRLLQGLPACLSPNLFTFQDFAEEVVRVNDPTARPLPHVQRRLLADDLVAELHARGRLPHFQGVIDTRGFAETVFDLLAELKQNEIWPQHLHEALAAGAAGARDVQCALIYQEYQERLIRHNLYDLEGRVWYARDLLGRGLHRPFAHVRAVFVDGFTELTRTQREILEILATRVEELWVTLPDEAGAERAELFGQPRALQQSLQSLRPEVVTLESCSSGEGGGRGGKPAGLAHLECELFRPLKSVKRSADADGLLCIEAPGAVGEARMAARQVRKLLGGGARPDDVLVVVREVPPCADLLREVFAEYDIPLDVEGAEPLTRNAAVTALLRAVRVPEDDWPFAAVTALLRSGYFRPDWPTTRACPEVAQHGEALLRLLGEPRGREAYLTAVRRWAEDPPAALEDEQAEESRRRRTHELAGRCRGFLEHFFRRWDDAPTRAPLPRHAAWVRGLADDLGIARAAGEDARDTAALARLWDELERWVQLDRQMHGAARPVERGQFQRTLAALASAAGLARTPRGPGRVRVLSADLARALEAPYVFVMGLGERSFPRLVAPEMLFDEQQRQSLRGAGVDIPCVGDMMPAEMLLFYRVVTSARRLLVLSYAALDDRGQELLPSSFLERLRDCFEPGALAVERRRMLIEGHDRDEPLSPAEHRVQAALKVASGEQTAAPPDPSSLASGQWPLATLLADAREVAYRRFEAAEHTAHDGLLRDPAVVAEVAALFRPDRILSPTALEGYIACPFRFFLGNVLRLEPLEEPSEEIESTERGLAFHRALSRLHTELRAAGLHHPGEEVEALLMAQLDRAVKECARHASPAAVALWRLEGERLKRAAARYRAHWGRFVEPWLPRQVRPRPEFFEVGFGLPGKEGEAVHGPLVIALDGLEVRVSGRIDRVDVAELPDGAGLGFWVIDYKTGRASNYTGADLKEYRRLQLTLYALAVEEVLLADRRARPLGLAYWLVADSGPKAALPAHPRQTSWLEEVEAWRRVREELRRWVVALVRGIRSAEFPLKPRSEDCTQTCDFAEVCRISQSRQAVASKAWQLPLPTV